MDSMYEGLRELYSWGSRVAQSVKHQTSAQKSVQSGREAEGVKEDRGFEASSVLTAESPIQGSNSRTTRS